MRVTCTNPGTASAVGDSQVSPDIAITRQMHRDVFTPKAVCSTYIVAHLRFTSIS